MRLEDQLIKIPNFNFVRTRNFNNYVNEMDDEVLNVNISSLKKFLNLKNNKNTKEYLIESIENRENQKKFIKVLSNYHNIPSQLIKFFKQNLPDEITNEMIVNKMLEYISNKYKEESILNIDIGWILFEKEYLLNQEGPREFIFHELKKIK